MGCNCGCSPFLFLRRKKALQKKENCGRMKIGRKRFVFKPWKGMVIRMERKNKINYYLDIAQTVTTRSTCLRKRYGAIIVRNDVIVSTGYNGAPRGRQNCCDIGDCLREKLNVPRGERYELCRAVHAEANAIISASRESMLGADLYLCGIDSASGKLLEGTTSCQMCKRLVINAGIRRVYVREDAERYSVYEIEDWIANDDSLGQIGY